MANESGKGRTRNWACILYPESAPDNWFDLLSEQLIPTMVSPLHDQDVNADGEPKKPHHHIFFMFDGVKTYDQVKAVTETIGATIPQRVNSLRGMARYLCHLDNPEKAQYEESDVRCLCGADYVEAIALASDKYGLLCEMMDWCDEQGITEYAPLVRYARVERPDWFRVLADNGTYMMREYLKSVRFESLARRKK